MDNATKQRKYRERLKAKEGVKVPSIDSNNNPLKDIVTYFRELENLEPIESQIDILRCLVDPSIKSIAVSCGRGYSKSTLASVVAMYYADEYSRYAKVPVDVLLISHQPVIYQHIDKFFRDHPQLKARLRNLGRSLEIPQKSFQFKDTWSQVYRIVPTTNSIRGQRCSVAVLDETASLSDNIINTALGCPTGTINKVIFISTPHKDHSMFNDIVRQHPEGWVIKQYSSTLCPWMKGTLERNKQQLALGKYSQEQWAIEVDGRVPEDKEVSRFDSKEVVRSVHKNVGFIGGLDSKILAGIDFGYGKNNRSLMVLVIVEKLKARFNVLRVYSWSIDTIGDTAYRECAEYLNQFRPYRIQADSKPVEFQGKIEEYGSPKITYVDLSKHHIEERSLLDIQSNNKETLPFKTDTGITYKQIGINFLSYLLKTNNLNIDTKEDALIEQLKTFREGMTYYDDLVQALILAVTEFPYRSKYRGMISGPWNTKQRKIEGFGVYR